MSLSSSDFSSISSLPCFQGRYDVKFDVSLLTNGLSHTCYKVTFNSDHYFVKKLNKNTGHIETACAQALSDIATENISPRVIYFDDIWLITEFVEGSSLAEIHFNADVKINMGMSALSKLHQQSPLCNILAIPALSTTTVVKQLIANCHYDKLDISLVSSLSQQLSDRIADTLSSHTQEYVLCHGDANYHNILIDKANTSFLIDFECSHLAPREFDIAMFLAINTISTNSISTAVDVYSKLLPSHPIDMTLISNYLLYSLLINGLWYLSQSDDNNELHFLHLAHQQWSIFDSYSNSRSLNLPNLLNQLV